MLEQMRKSSQSLLIYVLFGIVIAVFIINFGPQSQGCHASRHGQRVSSQRAGLVDRSEGRDLLHDLASSTVCPNRQPAAQDLAQAGQVWRDAIAFLGATAGDAEAGDDFVEDQ